MFTHRDYLAAEYRHQERIARAEQRRLLQSLPDEISQKPGYLQRTLNRAGEVLVTLGNRMQAPGVGHGPTAVSR